MGSLAKLLGRSSTPERLAELLIEQTKIIDDLRGEKSALIERIGLTMATVTNKAEDAETRHAEALGEYRQVIGGIARAVGMTGGLDAFGDPYPLEVLGAVVEFRGERDAARDALEDWSVFADEIGAKLGGGFGSPSEIRDGLRALVKLSDERATGSTRAYLRHDETGENTTDK